MLRRIVPPLVLVLIVIACFWKLTLTNQYTWLAGPDYISQVMPWFQFQAREWHHLRFPLWDPHSWAGHPFLAQAQPGAAYPLNWILFLLGFDKGWLSWTLMHWYYVLTRVLAALTFYWFCRDLGRSRTGSIIAGMTYGTAGFLTAIEWPQMVNGTVWAPLVFLFQLRVLRGERPMRNAILSGSFLGLMWLAGHHQVPLFVTLGSGFLWLYVSFRLRRVHFALAALAVGVLVSGFQTLPTAEYGRLAVRWAAPGEPLRWSEKVPYPVHVLYSLKPLSAWSVVVPGTDFNLNPFIGVTAFTLALIGLVRGWHDIRTRCLGALAMGGVLVAFGDSVFHGVLYALMPLVEKARVPAQAMILFHAGACALVAYGVDEVAGLSRRAAGRIAAALLAAGATLAFGGLYLFSARALSIQGDTRFMITALASILSAGLLLALSRGVMTPRAAMVLLGGLIAWEVGYVTGSNWPHADNKEAMAGLWRMAEDHDIRMFLQSQPGSPRIAYDYAAFPHNLGHWWGIEAFDGNHASGPELLWRRGPYGPRTRNLLGTRYWLGTKPLSADQNVVFRGASGRTVYEFPVWMPRAWSVHSVQRVTDLEATRLLDSGPEFRERSFSTLPPPSLEQCSEADAVEMKRHMANSVTIEASMACRGLVVLNDQYFPGWSATVDGKPVEIIDAYGLVRGVAVDAGKHVVEFRYRPVSVLAGAAMSLAGALIALAAAVLKPRARAGI